MTAGFVCWKCGTPLGDTPVPLARLAECRRCEAELHVCRMCELYDPRVARACREDRAEDVHDKEHANFCEWFIARPDAYEPRDDSAAQAARSELESLFGGGPGKGGSGRAGDPSREELERLFRSDGKDG